MASDLRPMKVLVGTRDGTRHRLSAGPATTVGMLKEQLREMADADPASHPRYLAFPTAYFLTVKSGRRVLDNAALGRVAFESRPLLLAQPASNHRKKIASLKRRDESGMLYRIAVKSTATGEVVPLEVKPSDTSETIKALLLTMSRADPTPQTPLPRLPNVVEYPSCYHLVRPRTGEVLMPNVPIGDLKLSRTGTTALVILTNRRLSQQMRELAGQCGMIRAGAARAGTRMLNEALEEPAHAQRREEADLWAYGALSQVRSWVQRKWSQMRQAFRSFDRDGSGLVSADEFTGTLRMFGFALPPKQEGALLARLDPNGDGLVDYYEFLALVDDADAAQRARLAGRPARREPTPQEKRMQDALMQVKARSQRNFRTLRRAFLAADADRSGSIDRREFARLLRGVGVDLLDDEVAALAEQFDVDGSGGIDYNEFARAVQR
jgi:calmodulin